MSYGQSYRITSIAPAGANNVVLHQIDDYYLRAELVALHVLIEDSASDYDRHAEGYRTSVIRQLLLPVPLSMHKAGLDLGELVRLLDGQFWEIRVADTPATLARVADLYPCEPGCRWVTTEDADDGSAVDFTCEHGDGCDLAEAGPLEIEAGDGN